MLPNDISYIEDEPALRAIHHAPMSRATDKVLNALDQNCRTIIELSPFCVLATQGDGGADITPRGDPPGFVQILDNTHLLIPDRVGNNRFDTLTNLFKNPAIGLIFLVPGMDETLRINGTAKITDDARLLEVCAMQGRAPKVGLLVTIKEAFMHCPKAFIRSKLWDPTRHIDRSQLPSYAEILMAHCAGLTNDENDRQTQVMAKRGLY
ncbi:MAG: pyridoxamine 5'-phosphate oxidase family protein [Hyphomicrobiales bacterium]|nr:pyridoxamine 5'-phosphate oxidase family protein [Hyphomicrobiales bacterium]